MIDFKNPPAAALDDQMRLRSFLDDLWRWKCGLPPLEGGTFEDFAHAQWSEEFERYMRNRLILGALRYGRLGAKGKPQYDRLKSIIQRLGDYEKSGNLELLVDVANLALLEFVEGDHPKKHFRSVDDRPDEEHVQVREKR